MALTVCEDCGHKVSELAVACPDCGRPRTPMTTPAVVAAPAAVVVATPAITSRPSPELTAQPMVSSWLGGIREARTLPAGTKVCKRCKADVALDSFRQKVGDGYLCSDCIDKDENRRRGRRVVLGRIAVGASVLVVALTLTTVALQLAPAVLGPRSSAHGK